ncbi:MAG: hypothetical protein MUE85_04810 [Microscillaceae bacterium]|jgi:hypothetical protein|nr:hypothetical protein [Microscillaceae bacterium]
MENSVENSNSSAFDFMAWASFAISLVGSVLGIVYLPVDVWVKAFMSMSYIFTVASCFTLAKAVRDKQESSKIINRVKSAKTEKLLSDYEKIIN